MVNYSEHIYNCFGRILYENLPSWPLKRSIFVCPIIKNSPSILFVYLCPENKDSYSVDATIEPFCEKKERTSSFTNSLSLSLPLFHLVVRWNAGGALTIPSRGALRQIHKVQFIKRTLKIDGTLLRLREGEEWERRGEGARNFSVNGRCVKSTG